jgi:lysophospholipase L1-like esterase
VGAFVLLAVALLLATACGGGGGDTAAADPTEEPKVTVAGDSISVGLGASLREAVDDGVVVKVIGSGGTGLARPDNFDWPARFEELARDFPPEVLVLSLGSNDAQDLADGGGGTVATMADEDGWDEEYRARLARSFDAFADTGTRVVWVGHVRTEDDLVADTNRRVHELATEVAASRDWVQVEDLAELTGSGADSPSDCLISDGLHLSVECYGTAAEALADRLGPV